MFCEYYSLMFMGVHRGDTAMEYIQESFNYSLDSLGLPHFLCVFPFFFTGKSLGDSLARAPNFARSAGESVQYERDWPSARPRDVGVIVYTLL